MYQALSQELNRVIESMSVASRSVQCSEGNGHQSVILVEGDRWGLVVVGGQGWGSWAGERQETVMKRWRKGKGSPLLGVRAGPHTSLSVLIPHFLGPAAFLGSPPGHPKSLYFPT